MTDDDGNQLYRKSDHTNSDIKVNSFLKDSSNSPFVLLNEYYKESLDTVCINPEACHVLDEIVLRLDDDSSEEEEEEEVESEVPAVPARPGVSDNELLTTRTRPTRQISTRDRLRFNSYQELLRNT